MGRLPTVSKVGKRGRPSSRDGDGLTEMMRRLLDYKRAHPLADGSEACRETGVALNTWRRYMKNRTVEDQLFKQRWNGFAALGNRTPPSTGGLRVFRGEHLNVPSFNPYTGKTAHVGVTHPYMEEVIEAIESPDPLVMILLPVRFAKTTLLEQSCVETYCDNPNARIIYICSNIGHVYERSYNVQRVLLDTESYPSLHAKWGPWIGKPEDASRSWTKRSFYVRGRNSPERSPSFSGYGINSKVYGARGDKIYLDDVDDPENGPEVRDAIVRNINGPIMSRITEGGKIRYIGTRCGPNDVPSRLAASGQWKVVQMAAITEAGESLCPEMYSLEEIEQMRAQMGEQMFEMMLMNNPNAGSTAVFTPKMIENALGAFSDVPEGEDWEKITGLDPATAGRAAIVTVAFQPKTRMMRAVDCEVVVNPRHDGLMGMLARQLSRHHPTRVVIEAQGGSHFFSDSPDAKQLIYDDGARITPFETGANKHDRNFGVPMLAREMEFERLRIANGSPADTARMKPLIDDLRSWQPEPGKRRRYDTVMALWFCVNLILDKNRAARSGTTLDPLVMSRPWVLKMRSRALR